MNSATRSLIILLVTFCTEVSLAQNSYNLTLADSGTAQHAPRIEYRNARAYLAYIQAKVGANGDIMFATRPLGQQLFSAPVAITTTGTVNASLQRGPEFVVTPDGMIHMVWMEQRFKANPDVFYSRGTENGTNWSEAIDISQDAQLATQDFPSIAADSSGNVYVAWIDNREIIEGKSMNDHVYLTRSFNGGVTWDVPRKAENNPGGVGGSCECCRTAIAASADGDLYIAYRTNMANIRDIFVSRSNDKGETFDESIRVQTKEWMVHACPATGPMVALDARENLHVVYRSAANANKAAIFYNLLPNGMNRTFTEIPLTPVGGSTANYADIAVTPNGALNVVYQQSGLIYERNSTNGGNSWSSATKLDSLDAMQVFPIVGYDPATSTLSTLWQDDRRDKNDILLLDRAF
ncbi:MAG TPA: sialidase family protein, partial [Candidatus Kapabacteria bacterium]|nr:sialidase family protein [Candidatus Kapabacteria bacterium]